MLNIFKCILSVVLLAISINRAISTAPAQAPASAKSGPLRAELLSPKSIEPISADEFRKVLVHHRGSIVLVNLWATWCIPCLKELPELVKLKEKFGSQGVKIITVSTDEQADLNLAKKVLAERGPGLNGYLETESEPEKFVSVIDPTWSDVMPTTFIIDREGKLNTKLLGGKTREEFESAILPLLKDNR